ncbi:MAG: hypothetical protein GX638_12045 [Crenarchaeota archaeon]|nr:hypothetical protein [Thermoproteota archaeon]
MDKCMQCGEEVLFPFRCNYCQNNFCPQHRLPESHNCPNLPKKEPLGGSQMKKEIAFAQAEQKQHDTITVKKELPIFRFNKNSKKKTKIQFNRKKRRN